MSRARLVLNPAAGADQALAYAGRLASELKDSFGSIEIALTMGPRDCEDAARRAVEDGCDVLFVGGGDGTLNEALNGVAGIAGALDRVTFGVIPFGTGNDFAQTLNLPLAIDDVIRVLRLQRVVVADVGRLNQRYFINVSAGGFIAEVSESVSSQLKTVTGRLAYLLGGAQALLDYEPVRVMFEAEPGGISFDTGMYAFAACNARMIGGGRLIAPEAIIDDGLLDFCVIEDMPTLEFVALLRKVSDGAHVTDPRVRYFRASHARLAFDRPTLVNTDGEVLEAQSCEYDILPRAARFFAGAQNV